MRCCARCRTPYNCGNKECRCHHAQIILFPETPQQALDYEDNRNNTRNPHIE